MTPVCFTDLEEQPAFLNDPCLLSPACDRGVVGDDHQGESPFLS
jgi:hypothetical protein